MTQPDPKRFIQDQAGQWWYHFGVKKPCRMKASVTACAGCGALFVQCPIKRQDGQPVKHCSRTCGVKAAYRANPNLVAREKSGRWNGGRLKSRGYIWVWVPPEKRRGKKRYTLEHRLVMEKMLGRYLEPHEQVHHKNGIRDDNRPENLELWVKQQPPGQRVHEAQHCKTCSCFK